MNIKETMQKLAKYIAPAIVVLIVLVAAGVFIYIDYSKCSANGLQGKVITANEAADKILKYVNDVLLQGKATATLKGVSEKAGLYNIKLDISGNAIDSFATKDGNLFFPESFDLSQPAASATPDTTAKTIGDFSISSDSVCAENGKPIVYFFGSESCPHCVWEKPVIGAIAAKFTGQISFKENIDSQNDMDVFNKYSAGGIPAIVLGCKYYRVGSGEQAGQDTETKNLTALICKLTSNSPAEVCNGVQDLINQISE